MAKARKARMTRTAGTRLTRRAAFALALAALAVPALVAGGAWAQERKKITLDDLVIEGNIQKPEAFFILPRTNLNFADLERREDLKSRIIKSVEKEPF
jgi:hypothetical protein